MRIRCVFLEPTSGICIGYKLDMKNNAKLLELVASDVFTGTTWHDAAKGLLKFIKQFVDHEIEETVWFDGKPVVDPHA